MHDRELIHVVEGLQDLETEPLRQGHRESLEVVVPDELVEIDRQHLEQNADMGSKRELSLDSNDVLHVIRVLVFQSLENLDFNFSLLVKLFPIFEDFDSYLLFGFVIETLQNDTEGSSAQFLLDFIPISNVVLSFVDEVSLVIADSAIC